MKSILYLILILPTILVTAQTSSTPNGGGSYDMYQEGQCLTDSERTEIISNLEISRKALIKAGILHKNKQGNSSVVTFEWPLKQSNDLPYNSYYGVSNYVDHDVTTGIEDYECSNRTYNGHQGTDYFTYPYPWFSMKHNLVEVVAAAPGVILNKIDNQEDDHCSCIGLWNAVYIQHSDGSVAWYGHLKKNSLTSKSIGSSVAVGEYLGVVGSSGCSTGPHLHFEVYDDQNNLIDPYDGNCNSTTGSSWWTNQPAFIDPTLNAIATHYGLPDQGCPGTGENPKFSRNIYVGNTIYLATYYRDQQANDVTLMRLLRPDGTIYQNWSHTVSSNYIASWWYWTRVLPTNGPFGEWTFEVRYRGETFSHKFRYMDPSCNQSYTNTWVGPISGVWNWNEKNWSLGYLPTKCDAVHIPTGNMVELVDGETYECYSMEVGIGSHLEVKTNSVIQVGEGN